MKFNKIIFIITILYLLLLILNINSIERFPHPDFDTDYELPELTQVNGRALILEYIDVAVLIIALILASYFTIKKRSRRAIFIITVFSIIYFGFYKRGCICPVGSVQNFFYSLFTNDYLISLNVLLIFIIPIIFTLFFGRSFCSSVCPLGAIQDIVILKPIKLPLSLRKILSFIPYVYLGFAILYTVTDTDFIICRYDPFVSIFRLNDSFFKVSLGFIFLFTGVFIARPYCRFLCPYGVILKWMALLSKYKVTITPSECIKCNLCENSCPFEVIDLPTIKDSPESRKPGIKKLGVLVLLLPVILLIFGFSFYKMSDLFAQNNPSIKLSKQIFLENIDPDIENTLEVKAFRSNNQRESELHEKAVILKKRFQIGGTVLGIFLALVLWVKLLLLTIYRKNDTYKPDSGNCLSCARCFDYCPVSPDTEVLNTGENIE